MGLDRVEACGRSSSLETKRAVVFEVHRDESETRLLHGPDHVGSGASVRQEPGLALAELYARDVAVVSDPKLPESQPPKGGLRSGHLGQSLERDLATHRYT